MPPRGVTPYLFAVVAGWTLRAWPALAQRGDWWRVFTGYDPGVYFSAAALTWQGELPYRDFVLAHPPGIVVLLSPLAALTGALGAAQAFSLARWTATLVGAANIVLTARLAHRAAGPLAALVAASCYAVFPEAVRAERAPALEPMLNLACLACADLWLSRRTTERPHRALAAGLCLGLAVTVKLVAVVWAVACAASAPSRRALGWLTVGAAIAIAVTCAPLALRDPGAFFEQTVLFQLVRPGDGIAPGLSRLFVIFRPTAPIAAAAALGLLVEPWRRGPRAVAPSARLFGTAWALLLALFLVTPVYWASYNAHLAPAAAHLAGLGAAWLWRGVGARGRRWRQITAALLIAIPLPSLLSLAPRGRERPPLAASARALRQRIPEDTCYLAFEPAWGLAIDRLPSHGPARRPINDLYATMLLAARSGGGHFGDARDALRSDASQLRLRSVLEGCEYLSMGSRASLQVAPQTREWLQQRWERIVPRAGEETLDLWRLRR